MHPRSQQGNRAAASSTPQSHGAAHAGTPWTHQLPSPQAPAVHMQQGKCGTWHVAPPLSTYRGSHAGTPSDRHVPQGVLSTVGISPSSRRPCSHRPTCNQSGPCHLHSTQSPAARSTSGSPHVHSSHVSSLPTGQPPQGAVQPRRTHAGCHAEGKSHRGLCCT